MANENEGEQQECDTPESPLTEIEVEREAVQAFCARVHKRAGELSREMKAPVAYCYRLAVQKELAALGGDVTVLEG